MLTKSSPGWNLFSFLLMYIIIGLTLGLAIGFIYGEGYTPPEQEYFTNANGTRNNTYNLSPFRRATDFIITNPSERNVLSVITFSISGIASALALLLAVAVPYNTKLQSTVSRLVFSLACCCFICSLTIFLSPFVLDEAAYRQWGEVTSCQVLGFFLVFASHAICTMTAVCYFTFYEICVNHRSVEELARFEKWIHMVVWTLAFGIALGLTVTGRIGAYTATVCYVSGNRIGWTFLSMTSWTVGALIYGSIAVPRTLWAIYTTHRNARKKQNAGDAEYVPNPNNKTNNQHLTVISKLMSLLGLIPICTFTEAVHLILCLAGSPTYQSLMASNITTNLAALLVVVGLIYAFHKFCSFFCIKTPQ